MIAYLEIYRVLKNGGICLIHEPSRCPAPAALKEFNILRQKCGIKAMTLIGKYTASEVLQQLKRLGLEQKSVVRQGEQGLSGIGFELLLRKI